MKKNFKEYYEETLGIILTEGKKKYELLKTDTKKYER